MIISTNLQYPIRLHCLAYLCSMQWKLNRLLWIPGLIFLVFGLWFFRSIVMYFLISVVLSVLGAPLCDRLENFRPGRKAPRWLAALLVLLVFLAGLSGTFFLVIPVIAEQVSEISRMDPLLIEKSFAKPLLELRDLATQLGLDPTALNPENLRAKLVEVFSLKRLSATLQGVFGFVGTIVGAIFSISFITFFLLREKYLFYRLVHLLTPGKHEPAMQRIMRSVNQMLSRYFLAILLQILVFTVYIWVGLLFAGERYAFTIALFAGIVNLIPYVGPWIGLGFGLVLGVTTHIGQDFYQAILPDMFVISIVFVVAVMLDNFITYPLIFSNTLKAHPLELFMVVLMGGTLGGITGMVLAAPVYTVLRIAAGEFLQRFDLIRAATRELKD